MSTRSIEIMEGIRNVINHTQAKAGDKVLVFADNDRDPIVVETFAILAKEKGCDVNVMWTKPTALGAMEEPSPVFAAALNAADVAIALVTYPILYTETAMRAMVEYGTKYFELQGTMNTYECLAGEGARFPYEVGYKICEKLDTKMSEGKTWKLKDKRGSDFTCQIPSGGNTTVGTRYPGMQPGQFDMLWGERCFWPELSGNGVLYFDGFYGVGYCWSGIPIKCTIKDGWCTKIEGGPEAKLVDAWTTAAKYGKHCCEVAIGENPRARINLNDITLIEAQRNAGVVHIALGNSMVFGGDIFAEIHLDGTILEPSVWIDDELIIDNGVPQIIFDKEVRELAKKYGNPDVLLSPTRQLAR